MVDRTKLRAFGNQGTCRFTFRFRSPIRGRDCQGSFFRRPTILSAHSTGRARSGTQPPRVPSRSDTMMEATRRKEPPTPRCPHISWNSTARWATNVTGSSYTCPERRWDQRRSSSGTVAAPKDRDCCWRRAASASAHDPGRTPTGHDHLWSRQRGNRAASEVDRLGGIQQHDPRASRHGGIGVRGYPKPE